MRKSLLIVDESLEVRENLTQMFSSMGISVHSAESGERAIGFLASAQPESMPSLIVVSQDLAESDTKNSSQSLFKTVIKHENPETRAIPMIVFSTYSAAGRLPSLENAASSHYCRLGAIANLVQLVTGMLQTSQSSRRA